MDRKKALAGAGAVALTAAAAALAISAAFGMVGFSDTAAKTGKLSTVAHVESVPTPTPRIETVIEDVPAPDDGAQTPGDDVPLVAPAPPNAGTAAAPQRTTTTNDGVKPTPTPQHINDATRSEPTETPEIHTTETNEPQDD